MGGMRKVAKGDNVLLFVELFELGRQMVLVAVQDDHPIFTFPLYEGMFIEMLDLF